MKSYLIEKTRSILPLLHMLMPATVKEIFIKQEKALVTVSTSSSKQINKSKLHPAANRSVRNIEPSPKP